ncbi:MAG TPA: hypothetical protein DDW50_05585 [Firmicutes bacterium]|jgi:hypothetical protein|nr:hypothetical protein [Bacillota bacterium]
MLSLLKKDTFIKDILWLLLVSVIGSSLFAIIFAMATDKYFAQAVTGIMGDFGEYDLLFQTKEELKGAMVRQIREIIAEHLPGAKLKAGISIVGKASFFLTLPSRYKTKAVYSSLSSYFDNLPGDGGFSVMTEPRLNITSVPSGIFNRLSSEIERIPGVRFTFKDGSSIGVIMNDIHASKTVSDQVKQVLHRYQILEVRLGTSYKPQELLAMGKKVSQSLLGINGVRNAQDITLASGSDDSQYMMDTLLEVKRFLMAYTSEVKIRPYSGAQIEVGDLLVLNGQNTKNIKAGNLLQPLEVVVKVNSKNASGIHGLIIQGDAGFLKDNNAFKLFPGDKIGTPIASIEVADRKSQIVYAMDQGVNLLTKINSAIYDFNHSTGGAGLTVGGIEKTYQKLAEVRGALANVSSSINGLSGRANRENLTKMVVLVDGIGDDLDYLAKTFGRVQILENRFNQALVGMQNIQLIAGGSSLLQNAVGQTGGIADKMHLLDSQLGVVQSALRSRVHRLDDFVNRFNPLVAVLLSWRNKAKEFALQADDFSATFTPGSKNNRDLMRLIHSTDLVLSRLTSFDRVTVKSGLNIISDHLFGSDKIDLASLIAELEKAKESLPRLMDEELGRSINLIDQYAGGSSKAGETLQVFTNASVDQSTANVIIKNALQSDNAAVYSLPVGTVQPDIRGELFKILAEVRSTIAALVIMILWVLTFILDQSLIISMFKMTQFSIFPKKLAVSLPILNRAYPLLTKIFSPANIYAVFIGGIWLSATFLLSGARIPYLNFWIIAFIGGILGVLISMIAEKINPICKDEVLAGLSLGLPFKTIMREIVIPAGRPGILQILNRWKMVMK